MRTSVQREPSEWLHQLQAWETIVIIFQLMKQRMSLELKNVTGAYRRECRRSRRRSRPEKGMKKKQTREGNAAEVAGPEKGMQKAEEGGLVSGSFSCKLGRRY